MVRDITKLKYSLFFYNFYFWISVAVPYLAFRGISLHEILFILSVYQVAIIIFEFPTGVVGDYFGHKTSLILGSILTVIAMSVILLPGPKYIFYVGVLLNAIGSSLVSGSDIALLKSISKKFKHDYSDYLSLSDFTLLIVAPMGTLLFKLNPLLPIALTILGSFTTIFFLLSIQTKKGLVVKDTSGNIFKLAFEGVRVTIKNKRLLLLFLVTMVIGGFAVSVKTIMGIVVESSIIDVSWLGLIIGIAMFLRGIGKKYLSKIVVFTSNRLLIVLIVLFLVSGFIDSFIYLLITLSLSALIVGALITNIGVEVNHHIEDKYRASVLSLQNLLKRLFSSVYLVFIGGLLVSGGIRYFSISTGLLFLVSSLILLYTNSDFRKNKIVL